MSDGLIIDRATMLQIAERTLELSERRVDVPEALREAVLRVAATHDFHYLWWVDYPEGGCGCLVGTLRHEYGSQRLHGENISRAPMPEDLDGRAAYAVGLAFIDAIEDVIGTFSANDMPIRVVA